jgi:DNA-binding CsgD family transcriptional regulator
MLRERTRNRPTHYNSRYKDSLSPRERDVLSLLSKGQTNAQIADNLGVGFETVKWHVTGILGKLAVDSREEAATIWNYDHSLRGRADGPGVRSSASSPPSGRHHRASVAVVAAAIGVIAIALSLMAPTRRSRQTPPPSSRAWAALSGFPQAAAATGWQARPSSSHDKRPRLLMPRPARAAWWPTRPGAARRVPDGQIWTKGAGTNSLVHVDPATRTIAKEVSLPFPVDDTTFVSRREQRLGVLLTFDAVVKLRGLRRGNRPRR